MKSECIEKGHELCLKAAAKPTIQKEYENQSGQNNRKRMAVCRYVRFWLCAAFVRSSRSLVMSLLSLSLKKRLGTIEHHF